MTTITFYCATCNRFKPPEFIARRNRGGACFCTACEEKINKETQAQKDRRHKAAQKGYSNPVKLAGLIKIVGP